MTIPFPPTTTPRPYWRIVLDLASVLVAVILLATLALRRPDPARELPPVPENVVADAAEIVPEAPVIAAEVAPEPAPAPRPQPDPVAVAAAQEDLETARRERLLAEEAEAAAQARLKAAELEAARVALAAKTLPERLRDPRTRLASVQTRGAILKVETDQLKTDLTSLAQAPRPRRNVLSDRTPVARPVESKEYHFEVRADRVAFIDLDRLVKKLEADAKLQIRLARGAERRISSKVGPVGAFSLNYVLSSALPGSLDSMLGLSVSYDLTGWEVVPERPTRGETVAALQHPLSEFSQILNTLSPGRAAITLWIYPNGFRTYRELKSILHQRGFEVAARPLPEGVAIRGSPNGSLSAGQ